jgi:hypothetical protein
VFTKSLRITTNGMLLLLSGLILFSLGLLADLIVRMNRND